MADENFLQPEDDSSVSVNNPAEQMPGLAGFVKTKFEDSENGRRSYELRWLQAYKNFRGIYDSTTQYRDSERSRVFIKITKTKVLAAYDLDSVAREFLRIILKLHTNPVSNISLEQISKRYSIDIDISFKDPDQWIKLASEKHTSGNQRRMANKLLEDFRTQMLGKICLEVPSEF